MKRRAFPIMMLGFITVTPLAEAWADQLESLIDDQKKAAESWSAVQGELPAVFLQGDRTGVEIYSPAVSGEESSALCEPVEFDELIALSRGDPNASQIVVNTAVPRVHALLDRECIIHPGDHVLEVGPGSQRLVKTSRYVIRREKKVCPNDAPYSLW